MKISFATSTLLLAKNLLLKAATVASTPALLSDAFIHPSNTNIIKSSPCTTAKTSMASPSLSFSALKYKKSFDDSTAENTTVTSHTTAPDSAAFTTVDKDINIAIVGGGIGGMALALSLADAGFSNLDIFESVPTISELGVGINIQPHAIRELYELGLGEELAKTGIPTREILYYHKNGQFIYGEPRGLGAGYNWPQYSMHRGKLLGLLYRAVKSTLGEDRIHTGHKVVDCGSITGSLHTDAGKRSSGDGNSNDEQVAWADFLIRKKGSDEEGAKKRITADLIIGCDGVHSNVRKALTKEGAPTWIGITMLRGLTRMKPFKTGRTMTIIGPIENEMV